MQNRQSAKMITEAVIFLLAIIDFVAPLSISNRNMNVSAGGSHHSEPLVNTINGTYVGYRNDALEQDTFLGMRYAQPPIGPLRFVPPQTINEFFVGTKNATSYLPQCLSIDLSAAGQASEDCLGINVVRPHVSSGPLPVLVWIYGGYFSSGSANQYNMSYVVLESVKIGKPIVGVTFNYRVSGFGFMVGGESSKKGYTNNGLRDQLKAIEWVQENIEAFNGDPTHIILWGESAGAVSVALQLASGRLNSSNIKGAMMDSGWVTTANHFGLADSKFFNDGYKNITTYLGCDKVHDSFACIQNASASDLQYAFNSENNITRDHAFNSIAVDYDYVRTVPDNMFAYDNFTKVPILIGANSDEGCYFTEKSVTNENITDYLYFLFPGLRNTTLPEILDIYEKNNTDFESPYQPAFLLNFDGYGNAFRRTSSIYGDLMYIAPKRYAAETWSNLNLTAYVYRFNLYDNNSLPETGAKHTMEIPYVFNNLDAGINTNKALTSLFPKKAYTTEVGLPVSISEVISKQFLSFVSTLNPNNHGLKGIPYWPSYNNGSNPIRNYVFDWRGVYTEADTFREHAIKHINSIEDTLFVGY